MAKNAEKRETVKVECTECNKIFEIEKSKKIDGYYILPVHHFKGYVRMCRGSGGYAFAE